MKNLFVLHAAIMIIFITIEVEMCLIKEQKYHLVYLREIYLGRNSSFYTAMIFQFKKY